MPYIDVNIDPAEFVAECSKREIEELISELDDGGYLNNYAITGCDLDSQGSFEQNEMIDDMVAINANYYQLSSEEIETIKTIAKRFR